MTGWLHAESGCIIKIIPGNCYLPRIEKNPTQNRGFPFSPFKNPPQLTDSQSASQSFNQSVISCNRKRWLAEANVTSNFNSTCPGLYIIKASIFLSRSFLPSHPLLSYALYMLVFFSSGPFSSFPFSWCTLIDIYLLESQLVVRPISLPCNQCSSTDTTLHTPNSKIERANFIDKSFFGVSIFHKHSSQ